MPNPAKKSAAVGIDEGQSDQQRKRHAPRQQRALGGWQSVPRQSEAEWPRGFAYRDAGLSDENWRLERIRNVVDWCGHARWGRCMPMRPFGRNTNTMMRIEKMTTSDHELPMN